MPKQVSFAPLSLRYAVSRQAGRLLASGGRSLGITSVFSIRVRARVGMRGVALLILGLALVGGIAVNLVRPARSAAATSSTVNFQARLETNTGAVAVDGWYNVEFKLYSAASGGSPEWTEDYTYNNGSGNCTTPVFQSTGDCRLQVINGYLTANLGMITAFSGINWDQQQWLTMNIGGTGATGSFPTMGDGEMSPRLLLTGVPYAFRSGQAGGLFDPAATGSVLTWLGQGGANTIQLPNAGTNVTKTLCLENDTSGCGFAAATGSTAYIQNQNASPQTAANFNIDGSGTIGTTLGVGGLATLNGGLTVNTATASGISVTSGSSVPTADQLSITNAGSSGVTTAGVNGLSINYKGGAAAVEAEGERIDLQPGTTSGGTWSALRIVPNATGAVSGVTENGIKLDNLTTPGSGTENAINIGTGWDNLLQSTNVTITQAGLYNGQTITSAANFTGTVTIQGANALTLGSGSNNGSETFVSSGGANTVKLQAPTTNPGSSYTLSLPVTAPALGQCLQNDGTTIGQLTFSTCSTLQTAYTASTGGTTPEIILDGTRNGVDIQDKTGGTIGSTQSLLNVRGVGTASTFGASLFVVNASGKVAINNGDTTATPTISYDLSFGQGANRTIGVETQGTSNANGNNLTVSAGTGNGTGDGGVLNLQGGPASATAGSDGGGIALLATNGTSTGVGGVGGSITITAGNAGGSNANAGGTITLKGGSATSTGTNGGILVKNAADSTATFQVQPAGNTGVLFNVDSTLSGAVSILTNNSGETEAWQTNANSLTAARRKHATVVANGYIYALGGVNSGGTDQATVMFAKLNANGSVGAWSCQGTAGNCGTALNANAMPAARSNGAAVAINGYIYYLGGSSLDTVYYAKLNLDGSTGAWKTGNTMNGGSAVINSQAFAANGNIYVLAPSGANEVYYQAKAYADGTTSTWTKTTAFTSPVNWPGLAVANGYVYLAGGEDGAGAARDSTIYGKINTDGTLSSWKCEASSSSECGGATFTSLALPGVTDLTAAQAANGYLYVIGGIDGSQNGKRTVYYTKLNSDGSIVGYSTSAAGGSGTSLPSGGVFWGGSGMANGYLYLVAGTSGSLGTPTVLSNVYYTSLARISAAGSLDLVGTSGQDQLGPGTQAGSLTAGNALLLGTLTVNDQANLLQGLYVGQALTVNGSALFQNAADSTTAFQVQNAAGTLLLGVDTTTAAPINYIGVTGSTATAGTVHIADSTGNVIQTVTIGSLASTSGTAIQGGTSTNAISIQSGASGTLKIGTTVQTSTLQLGNTSASSTTLINGGTGGTAISIQDGSNGTILIGTTNASTVTIGSASNVTASNTLTFGQSTLGETINIGNANVATGNTNTINIGTNSTSTGKNLITIGDVVANQNSTLTLQGGATSSAVLVQAASTGTITIGSQSVNNPIIIGVGGSVTNADNVSINNTSGATTSTITIGGSGASTGDIILGQSTGTQAVKIGIGAPAAGKANTISIGTTVSATTGTTAITIGGTSTTTNGATSVSILAGNHSGSTVANGSRISTDTNSTGVKVSLGDATSTIAVCSSLVTGTAPTSGTAYELIDCSGTPIADYAENYPVAPDVQVGDVVSLGTQMVNTYGSNPNSSGTADWNNVIGQIPQLVKANQPYQSSTIGIVSDNNDDFSSVGYNIKSEDNPQPIALNGRVLVKVSTENGPIQQGDYLTVSATLPGYAMKATQAGYVIGRALSSYIGSTPGQVMVFVGDTYYPGPNPASYLQNGADASLANLSVSGNTVLANLGVTGDTDLSSLNVSGPTQLTSLTVTGSATVQGNLTVQGDTSIQGSLTVTGPTTVADLIVGGHIITAGGQPTPQLQAAAGQQATVAITGTDTTGTITITTGADPTVGALTDILFSKAYANPPHIVLSPSNDKASGLRYFKGTTTANDFMFNSLDTPAPNTAYQYDYFIAQ